ncbi:MAG: ATP-binding protein [Bryobacteraceae bacterium]|nr:ATP-binding protein [Bryobacteraceae bacterium]
MRQPRQELRAQLPRTLESVEAFCQRFRAFCGQACLEQETFAVELLLREALGNSVAHGKGGLSCVVRGNGRRVLIWVRDDGPGFDWRSQMQTPRADAATHGRGLAIYYRYASRVKFSTRGNGVALVKQFKEERAK